LFLLFSFILFQQTVLISVLSIIFHFILLQENCFSFLLLFIFVFTSTFNHVLNGKNNLKIIGELLILDNLFKISWIQKEKKINAARIN